MFNGLSRLPDRIRAAFPERHVHLRSDGRVVSFSLSTRSQVLTALCLAAVSLWTLTATAIFAVDLASGRSAAGAVARTRAYDQKVLADHETQMNAASRRIAGAAGSLDVLARSVSQRHAALSLLLAKLAPQGAKALAPPPPGPLSPGEALSAIKAVGEDQDRLLSAADAYARGRAERLRLALRLAGVEGAGRPHAMTPPGTGGPLIPLDDAAALARILDVDQAFARRVAAAAGAIDSVRRLDADVSRAPLGQPVAQERPTSSYGVRRDPMTGRPAFHPGQDFGGAYATPVTATAVGVIAFTGQRPGYGNVVEINHDDGFMTRYAHLSRIMVHPGQRVAVGEAVGAMGSTGRSTGVHLHYEVWRNGRLQDPTRYLEAGHHVQEKHG